MGRTAARALIEEGEERGALRTRQEVLLELMQDRFGSVPNNVKEQIQTIQDINRLRELTRRVPKANSIDEIDIE